MFDCIITLPSYMSIYFKELFRRFNATKKSSQYCKNILKGFLSFIPSPAVPLLLSTRSRRTGLHNRLFQVDIPPAKMPPDHVQDWLLYRRHTQYGLPHRKGSSAVLSDGFHREVDPGRSHPASQSDHPESSGRHRQ